MPMLKDRIVREWSNSSSSTSSSGGSKAEGGGAVSLRSFAPSVEVEDTARVGDGTGPEPRPARERAWNLVRQLPRSAAVMKQVTYRLEIRGHPHTSG